MIARYESLTECEQLLDLLSVYAPHPCVAHVFSDIAEVQRLLQLYSFKTPQLADRLCEMLTSRYRYEIYALYGAPLSARQTDSSYLRLEQLLGSLVRVAAMRLACEGELSLTPSQIASSDGLLLRSLKTAMGRG
ncbi:MAG: hypothetical protein Q4G52_03950 [Clostridia bacterium]|nr:hypothetical protein [Clostridia bacterium]